MTKQSPLFFRSLIPFMGLFLAFVVGLFSVTTTQAQTEDRIPALFNERCANCHGETGQGDGELASEAVAPPRAFTSEFMQSAVPANLFDTVSNGRMQNGMPPFGNSSSNPISEDDRWELIRYLYAFALDPATLEQGESLWLGWENAPDFLTDVEFWQNNSNATVLAELQGIESDFSDEELEAIVDYRRVSTSLVKPVARLSTASVSGQILNGTTGEPMTEMEVRLRAFTEALEQPLTVTTTVDADGFYTFSLEDVPEDWFYITGVVYEGVHYNSSLEPVTEEASDLTLNIEVFEQTNNVNVIGIEQLHFVLEIVDNQLFINELYNFNNQSDFVFVGEQGDPAQGTVQINLPANASTPTFQRGFSGMEQFVPANDLLPLSDNNTSWYDTQMIRPGLNPSTLLAQYALPYEDNMTVRHPLPYNVQNVTLVLSDVGVELTGDWEFSQVIEEGGQSFLLYSGIPQFAGEDIVIEFAGNATMPSSLSTAGTTLATRNNSTELLIGGAILLLVIGGAVWQVRQWQQPKPTPQGRSHRRQEKVKAKKNKQTREELLEAIAQLDDKYEMGELDENTYTTQRQALKEKLLAIW